MCVGDSVWLGWRGIRVAGRSTPSPRNPHEQIPPPSPPPPPPPPQPLLPPPAKYHYYY